MPWIAIKDESSTAFYYKRPSVVSAELTHTHTHTLHTHNLKIRLLNDLALLSSSAQCETRGRIEDKDKWLPTYYHHPRRFPDGSDGKETTCNEGDLGSSPRSERSLGVGHGNSLQYSCLGNSMDRGAWQATVHGVTKSRT